MSTVTNDDWEDEARPGLLYTILRHLVLTAIYTSTYLFGVGVLCFIWVVAAVRSGGEMAGFIYLVLLSWALIFGQIDALDLVDEDGDSDWSLLTDLLVGVAGILYYNVIMFVAVLSALVFTSSGSPVLAVSVALLAPAGDFVAGQKFGIGLAVLMLGSAVWMGERLTHAYEKAPVEQAVYYLLDLIKSIEKAIPPIVRHLSLRYVGKHHRFF